MRAKFLSALLAAGVVLGLGLVTASAADAPYQVEWVYHVKYGYQGEWWNIFRKYQIAILDREKQSGLRHRLHGLQAGPSHQRRCALGLSHRHYLSELRSLTP